MSTKGFPVVGLVTTSLMLSLTVTPITGQAPTAAPARVTTTAPRNWTPPRTPWGDPDLQGNYTNKYEQGTPFERPAEFEGRRIDDITGAELKALVEDRATQVLLNAPFTGGDPEAGNFGGAPAFYDRFEANKGSRPWFVVDPPEGRVPAMTPEGQKASAARTAARNAARRGRGPSDSYTDRSLYDRCITRGFPNSMMPTNYGNSYRIVQGPGFVAITIEMIHETRIVPLDGSPHPSKAVTSYTGFARGRWEGDTLVVETTNFRSEPAYRNSNPEVLRLIERYTATGPAKVEWSVTVDDPTTWSRPWTFAMPLTRNDDEAVLEYACHEGNLAMPNLLSGARAEEKAALEAGLSGVATPRGGGGGGGGRGGRGRGAAVPSTASSATSAAVPAAPVPPGSGPLAGTWTLNGNRAANFAGYAPARQMVIGHSSAQVSVLTDTGTEGQAQTTVYKLDGTQNPVPGPLGWDTKARAVWQDGKLMVTVTRVIEGPKGPVPFEIKDVYTVAGDMLTLERSTGGRSQKIVYTRQ